MGGQGDERHCWQAEKRIFILTNDEKIVPGLLLERNFGWAFDGVGRAEPHALDVIVTDCSMPRMSGEELTRTIRDDEAKDPSRPRAVPIVGLTANAQPDAAMRAIASGMNACLVKPLALDDLREALLAVTRRSRESTASRTK